MSTQQVKHSANTSKPDVSGVFSGLQNAALCCHICTTFRDAQSLDVSVRISASLHSCADEGNYHGQYVFRLKTSTAAVVAYTTGTTNVTTTIAICLLHQLDHLQITVSRTTYNCLNLESKCPLVTLTLMMRQMVASHNQHSRSPLAEVQANVAASMLCAS